MLKTDKDDNVLIEVQHEIAPNPMQLVEKPVYHNKKMQMMQYLIGSLGLTDATAIKHFLTNRVKVRNVKICFQCGVEHTHHNDFCSADCCKVYKAREKLDRTTRKINRIIALKEVYRDNGITYTETSRS